MGSDVLNLQALMCFYESAKFSSINKAAKACFISASNLSRTIKALENEMNITLFKRTYSGIELTYEGRELYSKIESSIEDLKRIQVSYIHNNCNDILHLRICAHQSSLVLWAMIDFYNIYSDKREYIDIVLDTYTSADDVLRHLENNSYMLGLIHYNSKSHIMYTDYFDRKGYSYTKMPDCPAGALMRKGHPLAGKEKVYLSELMEYPRIAYLNDDPLEVNYCSDIENFCPSKVKKRILVKGVGELHNFLMNTDAYYIGINLDAFPSVSRFFTNVKIHNMESLAYSTLIIYKSDLPLSQSASKFIQILQDIFKKINLNRE
jgi:DNA-binding transcriptional LysR family regulator